jgi:ribosomal-protein-alanine N-acetyltransferase
MSFVMTHKLPWVEKLTASSFRWTEESIRELLTQNQKARLLVDNDRDPKAFILWLDLGDEVEVLALATDPKYHRSGLMSRLWMRWVMDLRSRKVSSIFLEVHAHNTAALHFYQKQGMVVVGTRRAYYQDGSDAILLKAIIGS